MSENIDAEDEFGARPTRRKLEPDAHGQAALVLAESILHALIETGNLTLGQGIGIIRTAVEVKVDFAEEAHETQGRMQESLRLLSKIESSLRTGKYGADETA